LQDPLVWLLALLGGLGVWLAGDGISGLADSATTDLLDLLRSQADQWSAFAQSELEVFFESTTDLVADVSDLVKANTWTSVAALVVSLMVAIAVGVLVWDKFRDNQADEVWRDEQRNYQNAVIESRHELTGAFNRVADGLERVKQTERVEENNDEGDGPYNSPWRTNHKRRVG